VVGNGEVTERQYFDELKPMYQGVVIHYVSKQFSPGALAQFAAERMKHGDDGGGDPYAKVWVVIDVDQFKAADLSRAERTCRENGLELVVSNPCFEVWLLDHKTPCPPNVTQTKDAEAAAAKARMTEGKRQKYIVPGAVTEASVRNAVANAAKHNTEGHRRIRIRLAEESRLNFAPWTDMPDVIEELGRHALGNRIP
jgi:hypothetical protein